ncbi:MAG: HAD family hydrolase [Microcoleus sp. PH2017_40_RAT_O_B]|uniref:HAD family hydrolase n=1 Tax=unclassified Microcoleus TaxID=2642155 RepID=UPI001E018323|nr:MULTISPECIES: HAD family hydrolase [unclassified Microcoleus]MCC3574300.1 HAD family hydrolase [Microcoleus sp. PH2017_34_RAT_O_A]MCC3611823.1 HAD family hydrolase [Microcoleus sp. PH2017_40_RAT_O_B]
MVTIKCRGISFSNIQAVIFDKDGTLEDSQEFLRHLGMKRSRLVDAQIPGVGEPLQMAFGIEVGKIDPTGLLAVGSRRENEIVAAGYIAETGRGWIESLTIAQRAFDEADQMLKNSPPSPLFVGSLEVLKSLSEAGLKLGILSAATTKAVEKLVKAHQLSEYIQLEMGVDSVHLNKPDPKLFLLACERLGVDPAETLMVGDSAGDIQMGKDAGAAGCIGICWGNALVSHLEKADVAIASLDEITILAD